MTMKIKMLIGMQALLQTALFLFVLFTAPNPVGHLKAALQHLTSGETALATENVSTAINGCEFLTTIILSTTLATAAISVLSIFFVRPAVVSPAAPTKTSKPGHPKPRPQDSQPPEVGK
jgi:hypothetical protein